MLALFSLIMSYLFALLLGLQASGHLWWWRTRNAQSHLNAIIYEPLQGSKCTNHYDTWCQSVPHAHEAKRLHNASSARTLALIQLGDDYISWMRDNGAEDTSNVTSSKGNYQLLALWTICTGLGYNIPGWIKQKVSTFKNIYRLSYSLIQELHSTFEAGKLHHGIWNLTHPQWHQALVKTCDAFLL